MYSQFHQYSIDRAIKIIFFLIVFSSENDSTRNLVLKLISRSNSSDQKAMNILLQIDKDFCKDRTCLFIVPQLHT